MDLMGSRWRMLVLHVVGSVVALAAPVALWFGLIYTLAWLCDDRHFAMATEDFWFAGVLVVLVGPALGMWFWWSDYMFWQNIEDEEQADGTSDR